MRVYVYTGGVCERSSNAYVWHDAKLCPAMCVLITFDRIGLF